MVVAIRIVLSLVALYFLYYLSPLCHVSFIMSAPHWDLDCVALLIGYCVGIPLAIALVAGYLKKSKPVFWNVLVGALVIAPVVIYFIVWVPLTP